MVKHCCKRKSLLLIVVVIIINVFVIYNLLASQQKDETKNFNYRYISILDFTSFHLDVLANDVRDKLIVSFEKDYNNQLNTISDPNKRMPLLLVGQTADESKAKIDSLKAKEIAKQNSSTQTPPPPPADKNAETLNEMPESKADASLDEGLDFVPGSPSPTSESDKVQEIKKSPYNELLEKFKFKSPELIITGNLATLDETGINLKLIVYIEDAKYHKYNRINSYIGTAESLINDADRIFLDIKEIAGYITKLAWQEVISDRNLLRKLDENSMLLIKGGRFVMGQNKEKDTFPPTNVTTKTETENSTPIENQTETSSEKTNKPGSHFVPGADDSSKSPLELYLPTDSKSDLVNNSVFIKEKVKPEITEFKKAYKEYMDFDESPQHIVYVKDFYLDVYEVTNYQYQKFLKANPDWRKGFVNSRLVDENYLYDWEGMNYPEGKATQPVKYVSWYAANAYAKWQGKRLPTEAEWEYAAGGINHFKWSQGNIFEANKYAFDIQEPRKVASFAPNSFGLFDMCGNVSEWCSTSYRPYPYVNDNREDFSSAHKVIRGGAWNYFDARSLRCSNRFACEPNRCRANVGFRTAK